MKTQLFVTLLAAMFTADNVGAQEKLVSNTSELVSPVVNADCKLLDRNGYKYTYMETDGGHIWRNWRTYLTEFSQLLFK